MFLFPQTTSSFNADAHDKLLWYPFRLVVDFCKGFHFFCKLVLLDNNLIWNIEDFTLSTNIIIGPA